MAPHFLDTYSWSFCSPVSICTSCFYSYNTTKPWDLPSPSLWDFLYVSFSSGFLASWIQLRPSWFMLYFNGTHSRNILRKREHGDILFIFFLRMVIVTTFKWSFSLPPSLCWVSLQFRNMSLISGWGGVYITSLVIFPLHFFSSLSSFSHLTIGPSGLIFFLYLFSLVFISW